MATEIERKFVVVNDDWNKNIHVYYNIKQGYILNNKIINRIRIVKTYLTPYDKPQDINAFFTVKGLSTGISRPEFEFEIKIGDACEMMELFCGNRIIEKTRYIVSSSKSHLVWEVDEFHGKHSGLVLAEIELDHPNEKVRLPKWLGKEVSTDQRYSNYSLAKNGMRLINVK